VNETGAPPRTDSRRFFLGLTAIALVALGVRVAAAVWYQDHTGLWGDGFWYSGVANMISDGKGFISPAALAAFREEWPTAAHPPLYPMFLSIVGLVDQDLLPQRLWSTLPGVGTVVLLGLLGREIASERAGLLAAAMGAVYVGLFAQDVLVMSEGLYGCMIVLTVYFAYRYLHRPNLVRAGLLSGAISLAALTRAEGALLFLILLLPLALRAKELSSARRWACVGVGALVAAVLFAPWLAYNNVNRFDSPVLLSTGLGGLVGSSNCPQVYDGPAIGGWGGICAKGVRVTVREDETKQDDKLLDAGVEYAREHADRLPVVIPYRLLRTFGFYQPVKVTAGDLLLMEGTSRNGARVAVLQYYLLLAAGIAGFVLLVRRKVAVLPFVAPVVTVALITIIGYGTMRFRVALDALLPALAAVALDAAWVRFSAGRRRSERLQPSENGDRVVV
jgi:hypothetical protein